MKFRRNDGRDKFIRDCWEKIKTNFWESYLIEVEKGIILNFRFINGNLGIKLAND